MLYLLQLFWLSSVHNVGIRKYHELCFATLSSNKSSSLRRHKKTTEGNMYNYSQTLLSRSRWYCLKFRDIRVFEISGVKYLKNKWLGYITSPYPLYSRYQCSRYRSLTVLLYQSFRAMLFWLAWPREYRLYYHLFYTYESWSLTV